MGWASTILFFIIMSRNLQFFQPLIIFVIYCPSTGGLLKRTLSLWTIFVVLAMVYYGLSLGGVTFSDDPYVYMALSQWIIIVKVIRLLSSLYNNKLKVKIAVIFWPLFMLLLAWEDDIVSSFPYENLVDWYVLLYISYKSDVRIHVESCINKHVMS